MHHIRDEAFPPQSSQWHLYTCTCVPLPGTRPGGCWSVDTDVGRDRCVHISSYAHQVVAGSPALQSRSHWACNRRGSGWAGSTPGGLRVSLTCPCQRQCCGSTPCRGGGRTLRPPSRGSSVFAQEAVATSLLLGRLAGGTSSSPQGPPWPLRTPRLPHLPACAAASCTAGWARVCRSWSWWGSSARPAFSTYSFSCWRRSRPRSTGPVGGRVSGRREPSAAGDG